MNLIRFYLLNTECMQFLEKDLEKVIFDGCRKTLFDKYGFYKPRLLKRQLRIGNYGIADMVGFEFKWCNHHKKFKPQVTIYEFKQDKISLSTFMQGCRYAKGVEHFFLKNKSRLYPDLQIRLVLVGKQLDTNGDFVYLTDLISGPYFELDIFTYDYCLDGLSLHGHAFYYSARPGF